MLLLKIFGPGILFCKLCRIRTWRIPACHSGIKIRHKVETCLLPPFVCFWECEGQEDGMWKRQAQPFVPSDLEPGHREKWLPQPHRLVSLAWGNHDFLAHTRNERVTKRGSICRQPQRRKHMRLLAWFPRYHDRNPKPLCSSPLPRPPLNSPFPGTLFKTTPEKLLWSILISTRMKIRPLRQRVHENFVLFLTMAHKSTMISKRKCNWKKTCYSECTVTGRKKEPPLLPQKPHPENQLSDLTNFLSQALPIYRYPLVPIGRSNNRKWHLFLPSPSPYQSDRFLKGNCINKNCWELFASERGTGLHPREEDTSFTTDPFGLRDFILCVHIT